MSMTILSAQNPKWLDVEHTTINLEIQFEHLSDLVVFTASTIDIEPHGRLIFERAAAGEYGEVVEFIPPTPADIAARDNPPLRVSKMTEAVDRATHWDMMGDTAQAAAWRNYYRELYALAEHPGWPQVSQWPEAPQ